MPVKASNVRNWFRHEVDGGWAWIVCAASFLIQFIVFGTIQSYGVIFIALLDEFKSGEYETAWIGSLAYGLQFFIGPITTTLCEHFGCRKMVFFGTGILMLALFGSSFSPNLSTLYFTFGILWGIGASFTFFPCILVLRFYFSERISLANGISMSGAGIGTIVINVALNRVIQDYGWRTGLRMLGGIVTFMFVCGSVYLPPPSDFYAIREWSNYKKVKFTAKLSRILDVRPWKRKAFVVYVLGISLVLFGYFVPYVHLVRYGETLGVSSSQGVLLVGYMSISQIFAKLFCGRLADMKRVKRLFIIEISILGFAICNMAITAAKGYNALLAYAVFFGFFDGLFVVVLPILICDIVGRDLMATAIGGFYGVVATPMMLGPPISGQLYDAFNSYDAAFFGAAFLMIVGGIMMYAVYRLKPELVRTELQFSEELGAEDMFTSNLFSCPSIHSHTVDALSGMFLSERYSMVNLDRPSQITFNPLHNLNYGTKSRTGSSVSRQTYFSSFATDDRSEGRSEIFLQRLRGSSTATETGPHLYGNEQNVSSNVATFDQMSVHSKDDGFSTSTPKVLSIDDLFVREMPEATSVGSTTLQNIGASDIMNKDEITGHGAITGEQAYVNEITALEDIASTETLVNLCLSEPQTSEVLNTVPEEGMLAESEIAFLDFDRRTNINEMKDNEDLQPSANQLQAQVDHANEEDNVPVGLSQGVLKVEGLQHALPIILEGIELAGPVNLQTEELNKESLPTDLSASTAAPSTDFETTDGDPTVKTATLVEISDAPLSDKLDDSDTLVLEDTDLSSETFKYEGSESEFGQNVAENQHEDDALIKLPPPPNVVRKNQEMISSPLVDLKEDKVESTEEGQEPDNQNILVNILEDVNDVGQEAEHVQSTIYTEGEENKMNVSPYYPAIQAELVSPKFAQGHTGDLTSTDFTSGAQDFHTPVVSKGINSTHLDLLSRRLEAVAAEQMKGELIIRFPTDEMTLFAASRSMVPTPFENQGTPVYHNVPCSSQQSNPSAQRTPGDTSAATDRLLDLQSDGTSCTRPTAPNTDNAAIQDLIMTNSPETWQQPSHAEGQSGPLINPITCKHEVLDGYDSQCYADHQENKDLPESYQENDMIKIPPPPDFGRRRPSVFETQEPIILFRDLESDVVDSELEDDQRRSCDLEKFEQDTCSTCNHGSAGPPFLSSDFEKEEGMTKNACSPVPRGDMISPVFIYADQEVVENESAQEFHSPALNRNADSLRLHQLSERLEDVANKQLQGELSTRFLTDEMTLFAASRSMNPTPFEIQGTPTIESDAPTSVQPVTTASSITSEISNFCSTNPVELAAQDDVQFSLSSNTAASEVIPGISANPLPNPDFGNAGIKLVSQHGLQLQRCEDTDSSMPPSLSPANYESICVLDNERPSMPTNPFLVQGHVSACGKNDKSDLLPAQGHPEESRPIRIPLKPERERSSRKPLTIEDSLECSLSRSSNSMVKVFEIELDEDLKDRGNLTQNLAPTPTTQVTEFENVNVGSSTNPFIIEMQERFPLDVNIQKNDFQKLQQPMATEIPSVSKPDGESTSDTLDHYYQDNDVIHDIVPTEMPVEKEIEEITSLKKIKSTTNSVTKEDVCGEESNKKTSCNEPQECISTVTNKDNEYYKGSEFEALDKEISNQLALIKENLDCYPEDGFASNCIDNEDSGNVHESKTSEQGLIPENTWVTLDRPDLHD